MKQVLTDKDIKNLKYQCRMGYILPVFFLIISNMVLFLVVSRTILEYSDILVLLIVIATVFISLLLNYQMNRKYLADIRNGERIFEIKKIQSKEMMNEHEAGSATLFPGQEMNEFTRYNLIIDNTRYRVDKELFEDCESGDEIVFFFAPESNYLLSMELKK